MLQCKAGAYCTRKYVSHCGSAQLLFLLKAKRIRLPTLQYCSERIKKKDLFSKETVMSHLFQFSFIITGICDFLNRSGYRFLDGLFVHNKHLIRSFGLMLLASFMAHPTSKVQFHMLTRHQVNGLWQSANYISKSTLNLTKIHGTYCLFKKLC